MPESLIKSNDPEAVQIHKTVLISVLNTYQSYNITTGVGTNSVHSTSSSPTVTISLAPPALLRQT